MKHIVGFSGGIDSHRREYDTRADEQVGMLMQNTYQFQLRARCPVHEGLTDTYEITLRSESMIEVEKILAFVAKYREAQVFQETMTLEIALGLGVQAETVGTHSGIQVRSIAP